MYALYVVWLMMMMMMMHGMYGRLDCVAGEEDHFPSEE